MEEALRWVDIIGNDQDFYKVGLPLYLKYGKKIIEELRKRHKRIFLDLKLHDIPSVVAQSFESFEREEVEIVTVHISGGSEMLKRAREEAYKRGIALAGVSVLTSLSRLEIQRLFAYPCEVERIVESMLNVACECEIDYAVLSGIEVSKLGHRFLGKIGFIVPGVRMEEEEVDDQARVITPQQAKTLGISYIVVGRPITHSPDPVEALKKYKRALS
uniref:Orotidine 5'-phosphate decarboxylase n=1 Tax=candidate division WOR-3 bacterium TaxID=2052148 RepID=A0A7V4E3I9_UNCW3